MCSLPVPSFPVEETLPSTARPGVAAKVARDMRDGGIGTESGMSYMRAKEISDRLNREACEKNEVGACPFCGGYPLLSGGGTSFWQVTCGTFRSQSGLHVDERSAAAAWNRRAP